MRFIKESSHIAMCVVCMMTTVGLFSSGCISGKETPPDPSEVIVPVPTSNPLPPRREMWVETTAQIVHVESVAANTVAVTLEYSTKGHTSASGADGDGAVMRQTIYHESKPLMPQEIRIRFLREEPLVYKVLEAIQWEK